MIEDVEELTTSSKRKVIHIQQSLATTKDMAPDTKKMAEDSARAMLSLLSENSQTCQILPSTSEAALPLLPSMRDGKNVDAYKLEVEFPETKAALQIDTAASGLYISRTLAEANGFKPSADTPPGTVHVDHLQVGPLEFRDCIDLRKKVPPARLSMTATIPLLLRCKPEPQATWIPNT
ncbi:MAG TPA: retropepsin-like aspartic protease [Edaphobacter sp.]|uniref:retropepsin-like aspartic protease n=1 Tax=Edaphobacter sp. TaxID=1934404 RepID=UPI002C30D72D|nr:retropepsin-like aspartic protease [Edaphobacter sp.]HUZ94391.1 retropepsin-like aspartic protease [Edaphobacter sp.]